MPPCQVQLGGTTSKSVGIGWYASVGFDDKRLYGLCARDCNRGSTVGIGAPLERSTAGTTVGGLPVIADPPNCCWFELPAAEGFERCECFPEIGVDVGTCAESVRHRFDLVFPVSPELSVDARNLRLLLRG